MERFEKELAKLARKRTDVFDECEESEAKGIMKEDGVPVDDGKVQTDDVGIWRTILVKLLRTIVKEDSDARTAAKWNEICKRRLQDCATGKKQLLPFAEDLERATKMFFWGTCLFVNDVAKRDSKEHKIGFSAYQIFYQLPRPARMDRIPIPIKRQGEGYHATDHQRIAQ